MVTYLTPHRWNEALYEERINGPRFRVRIRTENRDRTLLFHAMFLLSLNSLWGSLVIVWQTYHPSQTPHQVQSLAKGRAQLPIPVGRTHMSLVLARGLPSYSSPFSLWKWGNDGSSSISGLKTLSNADAKTTIKSGRFRKGPTRCKVRGEEKKKKKKPYL